MAKKNTPKKIKAVHTLESISDKRTLNRVVSYSLFAVGTAGAAFALDGMISEQNIIPTFNILFVSTLSYACSYVAHKAAKTLNKKYNKLSNSLMAKIKDSFYEEDDNNIKNASNNIKILFYENPGLRKEMQLRLLNLEKTEYKTDSEIVAGLKQAVLQKLL